MPWPTPSPVAVAPRWVVAAVVAAGLARLGHGEGQRRARAQTELFERLLDVLDAHHAQDRQRQVGEQCQHSGQVPLARPQTVFQVPSRTRCTPCLGGRPVGVREPDQFRAHGPLRPQAGQQVLCLRLPLRAGILVGGLPRDPRGDARPGSSATRGSRLNRPRRGCSAHRCARALSCLRHAPGITLHPHWRASLLHGPHAAIAPACEQVAEAILHNAPATLFSVHYSLLTPMRLPRVHATAAEPDSPSPHTAARRSHYPPHCD